MSKEVIRAPYQARQFDVQVKNFINKLVSNIPADSTASDVAGIVADFNALLAVFRALDTK